MNTLIEKRQISEMACGSNFSYILGDNTMFSSTEYKVLQSRSDSCFVRCMKMQMNGHIQLYYLTSDFKPLSALLSSLDPDSFLVVISNMLADMIEVKQNGFLSCENIDISFERIYVDPSTLKISLIYLPVNYRLFDSYSDFENELRTALIKVISNMPYSAPKLQRLISDLSNALLTFEDIFNNIKGDKKAITVHKTSEPKEYKTGSVSCTYKLVAVNAPMKTEILVNRDEFIVGKKAGMCDGVITFNKMISRRHCKFNLVNGSLMITDLQSANGTFVNRVRLRPNQPEKVNQGDIIRLADTDFQLVKEQ